MIFVGSAFIGGYTDLKSSIESGEFDSLIGRENDLDELDFDDDDE